MKLVAIPFDSLVGVDGEFRNVDMSSIVPTVNALRWDSVNGSGAIELIDGETTVREFPISSLGEYQWLYDAWVAAGQVPAKTLAQLKAERRVEFNRLRERTFHSGVDYAGKRFDTDPESIVKVNGAVTMALIAQSLSQPFFINWTTADDSVMTLDSAGMIQLGLTVGQHADALHQRTRTAKQALASASTPEAVAAIQW